MHVNAERELDSSPVSSSMSSKLAGVLVIGCLVAGIAISGRHRPNAHTDEEALAVEALDAPIELPEHSDYFRRPERPRSPAANHRRENTSAEQSTAANGDPLAETVSTNLPTLPSTYSPRGQQPDKVERASTVRTEQIAEPSPEVRLVSGTSPARPKVRVRPAAPTENVKSADEADASPPLRPSHPATAESPREDQPRRVTHTIRDGDTLESIAELRLGSARRWRELYDLNRATLSDPESLPVGAKLRLPQEPRKIAAVQQSDADELEPIGLWENGSWEK